MKIHLLRHATIVLSIGETTILVDPMLADAGTADPIANTPNQQRNPLVDLPFGRSYLRGLIKQLDGVIVTHRHNDHWDALARELLPKSLPILCQPEDRQHIEEAGFRAVKAVEDRVMWQGNEITRTGGQHGRGEIGKLMAPVSGFVLKAPAEPAVYVAGDTVWCEEVQEAIDQHRPGVIIVNAGAAQFTTGGPITMPAQDVISTANAGEEAVIIAVHMEAINHCLLTRRDLEHALSAAGVASRVYVPQDGEQITLPVR